MSLMSMRQFKLALLFSRFMHMKRNEYYDIHNLIRLDIHIFVLPNRSLWAYQSTCFILYEPSYAFNASIAKKSSVEAKALFVSFEVSWREVSNLWSVCAHDDADDGSGSELPSPISSTYKNLWAKNAGVRNAHRIAWHTSNDDANFRKTTHSFEFGCWLASGVDYRSFVALSRCKWLDHIVCVTRTISEHTFRSVVASALAKQLAGIVNPVIWRCSWLCSVLNVQ